MFNSNIKNEILLVIILRITLIIIISNVGYLRRLVKYDTIQVT